jgi:hypothetical protein
MSISHSVPGAAPAQVVADAVDSVGELTDLLWAAQSDEELGAVVEQVQVLRSVLAAVEACAVVEVDVRGVAKDRLHYGSTGDWLTHTAGLRRGQGQQILRRAHALTGDRGRTHRALADGMISSEQATIVLDAVAGLPSGELVRARGEKVLVSEAGRLDASELARAGRHLAEVVDPDRAERRLEAAPTARTGPPTPAATSPSPRTVPEGSGSRATDPPRTAPSSKPHSCP